MAGERLVSVMGDSISTFEGANPPGYAVYFDGARAEASGLAGPGQAWWSLVAARMGWTVLANASYSGSMVEGAGFPAAEDPRRAADLAPGGRVPDEVLVFMGTNDYGWGSARAQAAGRSAATPPAVDLAAVPPAVAGAAGPEGLEGFSRAYGRMLRHVRAACPGARVWCVPLLAGRVPGAAGPTFCWNLRGVPMRSYNARIAERAREAGCLFADAASLGLDYEASDGTHPTARGMRQLASLVLAAVRGEGADGPSLAWGYPPSEGGPRAWASRELCPGRACVGCGHARGTGNAWCCVCERDLA